MERLLHTFQYELTPKRTGRLKVPAATVDVDGKTYRSQELQLRVKKLEDQDLVKMTITAEPETVYPTQSFDVVLSVAVKALPAPDEDRQPVVARGDAPPRLEIPWVEDDSLPNGLAPAKDWRRWIRSIRIARDSVGFGINRLSTPGGFMFGDSELIFHPSPRRIQLPQKDGTLADYWQYQFRRRFTAERIGDYEFGPVTYDGPVVTGVTDRSLVGETVLAIAKPITVVCRDVPLEGRPESYIGAVGVFSGWSADLVPKKASVGTPMTLNLTIEGTGSLGDVFAPDLSKIPDIDEAFKVYEPTREQKDNSVTFTYTVRPKKAGTPEFPAIPASYYNVKDEMYVTLNTEPIPIEITKADRLGQGDILSASPGSRGNSRELHRSEEGLYANITSFSALRNQAVHPVPWLVGAGSLGVLYAGIALVTLRVRKLHGDEAFVRRRGAVSKAKKRLAAGGDETRAALVGLVADAANIPEAGATTKDVCRILREYGVEEPLLERLAETLEKCDAARYAPSPAASDDLQHDATHVLDQLTRALKKKRRL